MPQIDEVTGIFDVIEHTETAHDPVEETQEEVSETPVAEGSESTTETTETKEGETSETSEETKETGKSAEGQTETTEVEADKETLKSETTEQEDFSNWKDSLPPAPLPYQGKTPEYGEDGSITNMTAEEYQEFLIGKSMEGANLQMHRNLVENRAIDIAEKILPEIKTNPLVGQLVRDLRIASVVNGDEIDFVQAAIQVRDALGIAPDKLAAAKAEGANSAKASVTIQKAAALETGSSENKTSEEGEKVKHLQSRIARGDDEAFAELLSVMDGRK